MAEPYEIKQPTLNLDFGSTDKDYQIDAFLTNQQEEIHFYIEGNIILMADISFVSQIRYLPENDIVFLTAFSRESWERAFSFASLSLNQIYAKAQLEGPSLAISDNRVKLNGLGIFGDKCFVVGKDDFESNKGEFQNDICFFGNTNINMDLSD